MRPRAVWSRAGRMLLRLPRGEVDRLTARLWREVGVSCPRPTRPSAARCSPGPEQEASGLVAAGSGKA